MIESISGVSGLSGVSGAAEQSYSSPYAALSSGKVGPAEAARQPDAVRVAEAGAAEAVGSVGLPDALSRPMLPVGVMNLLEGEITAGKMVEFNLGLMNYGLSLTVMNQTHKKISESKSALMNEGKNA